MGSGGERMESDWGWWVRGGELSHDCAASVERSCCNRYGQSVRGDGNWDMAIYQIANIMGYEGLFQCPGPALKTRKCLATLVHWTERILSIPRSTSHKRSAVLYSPLAQSFSIRCNHACSSLS
jgi:hypothetical protein